MKYIIFIFYFVSTNPLKNIYHKIIFFEKIFPLKFDTTVNLFSESPCKAFLHSKNLKLQENSLPGQIYNFITGNWKIATVRYFVIKGVSYFLDKKHEKNMTFFKHPRL